MRTRLRAALVWTTVAALTLSVAAGAAAPPEGMPPPEGETPGLHTQGELFPAAFSDTTGHVFSADVEWLADSGVTRGCNPPDNTLFCPDDHVTRGQMAAFLHRALPGLEPTEDGLSFSDTTGHVFASDVAWLASAGVTRGCNPPENTRFCPDEAVTRGQMAAFLGRALSLPASTATFSDTAGHTFAADIAALATAGITRGCNPPDNTRFCPDDPVTRGQMAAFLHRALASDVGDPDPGGEEPDPAEVDAPEDGEVSSIETGTSSEYQPNSPDGVTDGQAGELDGQGPPVEVVPAELSTGPASDVTVEELEAAVPADQLEHLLSQVRFQGPTDGLEPQMDRRLGVLGSTSNYLAASATANPVGVLLSYRNGTYTGSCTGTLVSRNLVLTAAHCLVNSTTGVDNTDYLFYPGFHPQKTNNTVWQSVTGYRWPRFNQLAAANSTYKWALDYGLVELAPQAGSHAGDIYGWWPVWMSPPLNATYDVGVSKRWSETRVLSGYPREGWYGNRTDFWPWVCNTSSGSYFNWGSGYWQIGSGCTSSGGQSGGPIWGVRNGRWYVISVTSTLEYTVGCAAYPCYGNARFSYGYNVWGPTLLGTNSGFSFLRLWQAANS